MRGRGASARRSPVDDRPEWQVRVGPAQRAVKTEVVDLLTGHSGPPDTHVLKEMIGRGAEGEVWRAELRLSTEGRATVAVKTMFRPPSDEAWERQSRLLTTLSHPGLVRVTSMFIGPAWHLSGAANPATRVGYVVMDFVEGMTLREWWEENPAARVSERIRKLRTVAAALDQMHSGGQTVQGVAHGDVKPPNIVVRADGVAVLVDLGLARLTDGTGIAGRTAPYAAPELRVVDPMPTPEADRFAFVVTVAEVLLGAQVPRLDNLGWVDLRALDEALNRNPTTANRPALIKHILDALSATHPADRCRPAPVGLTTTGSVPATDAAPATRTDWLSAWLDSATDVVSQLTGTGPGSTDSHPVPLPPAALGADGSQIETAISAPRGVPAGGWTAGSPPAPDPLRQTAGNLAPMPPASAAPPPGGTPPPARRRRRWPFVAAAVSVVLAIAAAALLLGGGDGGGAGAHSLAARGSTGATPGRSDITTTPTAGTRPTATATATTEPVTADPTSTPSPSPENSGGTTPTNAPLAAGTTDLSAIRPVSTTSITGLITGPQQIGTTNYPSSVRFNCTSSPSIPCSITYNVAGAALLDAVIGVPNDATRAAGVVAPITFFKDSTTQLGPPVDVVIGQPQTIHLSLQGATQLIIQCHPTDNIQHSVYLDLVLGNAIIGPGTPVAASTKSS